MMYDTVIRGGRLVTPDGVISAEIALSQSKIAAIGHNLSAKRIIDASDKLVIPGGTDIHVHMQMPLPGTVTSDSFFTGTRAAALGGTTTIVDFVHPEPQHATLMQAYTERRAEADPQVAIDYALHMAILPHSVGMLDELPALRDAGSGSYKLYMAYGNRLTDDQLYKALAAIRDVGGMAVIHAENWDVILALQAEALARGETHPRMHPRTRPALLEAEATARAIDIANYVNVPIHIFHVSSGLVAERIRNARRRGLPVTGETCPQYLLLNDEAFEREGVLGAGPICSPPIREQAEQDALWRALQSEILTVVAADHCPFMLADKQAGYAQDFTQVPGGVPGVEVRLAAVYSGVRSGKLSLEQWVNVCCTEPARVVGLRNKGALAVGMDADVVVFDPEREMQISAETLAENCDWTPYDGLTLTGWPETVLCRGETVVEAGSFVGVEGFGRIQSTA